MTKSDLSLFAAAVGAGIEAVRAKLGSDRARAPLHRGGSKTSKTNANEREKRRASCKTRTAARARTRTLQDPQCTASTAQP